MFETQPNYKALALFRNIERIDLCLVNRVTLVRMCGAQTTNGLLFVFASLKRCASMVFPSVCCKIHHILSSYCEPLALIVSFNTASDEPH